MSSTRIEEDRPRVVKFVGERYPQCPVRQAWIAQVFDVGLLALAPGRLRRYIRIRARLHDGANPFAEQLADSRQRALAALVLDGVVQERGDRLVLVAAVVQYER